MKLRPCFRLNLDKVNRGCRESRTCRGSFLFLPRWEVVQSVGLQTLDVLLLQSFTHFTRTYVRVYEGSLDSIWTL